MWWNNLDSIILQNSDVMSFFDEFEKAVNDLVAAGTKFNEQRKQNYMLKVVFNILSIK